MKIFIMEKNDPFIKNDDGNNKLIKDGIHIMYPYICTNAKLQFFIRDVVIHKIKKDNIFEKMNLINKIEDVIDISIIERNNWLLYGSCKSNDVNQLYTLSKIYDFDCNLLELEDDVSYLPSILSIRKYQ